MPLTVGKCVTLDKLFHLPEPQFHFLFDGSSNTCHMGFYDH